MIVSERIQKHFTLISENSLNLSKLGRTIPAYSQCKTSVLISALLVIKLIIMTLNLGSMTLLLLFMLTVKHFLGVLLLSHFQLYYTLQVLLQYFHHD